MGQGGSKQETQSGLLNSLSYGTGAFLRQLVRIGGPCKPVDQKEKDVKALQAAPKASQGVINKALKTVKNGVKGVKESFEDGMESFNDEAAGISKKEPLEYYASNGYEKSKTIDGTVINDELEKEIEAVVKGIKEI